MIDSNAGERLFHRRDAEVAEKGVWAGRVNRIPIAEGSGHLGRQFARLTLLRSTQPPDNFPAAEGIVTDVPSVDCLRFGFEGTMRQHGIIDAAPDYAQSGRGLQSVGVFIAIQRDDGQALADVADEEHCLFAADAALARHPRQSGVNLGQTVRSAAAG